MLRVEITENEEGRRLDRLLKKMLRRAPLSFIYRAIRLNVKVNGRKRGGETILAKGDVVEINLPDELITDFSPPREGAKAKKQFQVVYEDDMILVVSKPFGLLTHGDVTEKKNTLANQVLDYLTEKGDYDRRRSPTFAPAPANRLDRNTTGLVLFGKTLAATRDLAAMFRGEGGSRWLEKTYRMIVVGKLDKPLTLKGRMARDEEQNKTVLLAKDSDEGLYMETYVRPLSVGYDSAAQNMGKKESGGTAMYTLAEADIATGRTHQIRVHLAGAGHPILGDRKYGDHGANRMALERFGLKAQLLHAYRIRVKNGIGSLGGLTGKEFRAELPEGFLSIAEGLGCKKATK